MSGLDESDPKKMRPQRTIATHSQIAPIARPSRHEKWVRMFLQSRPIAPGAIESTHGRGVYMMKAFMDEVL